MKGLRYICFTFLLLLFGCNAPHGDRKNVIHVPLSTDPPSLDPRRCNDTISTDVLKMCFEGLTRINPDNSVGLAIAERVKISSDQLSYVFYISDSYWTNGEKLTAYDFEESWKRVLHPEFPANNAYLMYMIKNAKEAKKGQVSVDEVGIKALSEKKLRVELKNPTPYFLELLASPVYFPYPDRIAKKNPWNGPFICNGPFKMENYKFGNYIKLVKNYHYWDQSAVSLDGIVAHILHDQNTALNLYEQDELDWVGSPLSHLSIDAMDALADRPDFNTYDSTGIYYYIFNLDIFPLNNEKIRKALSLAINRQELVDHVTERGHIPAYGFLPPSVCSSVDYFKDKDIELANKLFKEGLNEIGIKKEDFPKICLSYNSADCHNKLAQAIQNQWSENLGINIELTHKEWKVFLDEVNNEQFMIARMGELANYADPIALLEIFYYRRNKGKFHGWDNSAFYEKLHLSINETSAQRRMNYFREAEEILMNDMPILPIYFYRESHLLKDRLKGTFVNKVGSVDFKWAYIEQ